MNIATQHLVYFSATHNTQHVIRHIGEGMGYATVEHNITKDTKSNSITLTNTELLIVGVPSFAGRVPVTCVPTLQRYRGNDTPAIIFCTYGNRDYDDTLLELKDILEANGFKVISAAAFVSQHSIFPKVGEDRPNKEDDAALSEFVKKNRAIIENLTDASSVGELKVKGNYPYKPMGSIPLKPTGDKKCDACGVCVHLCPTDAIPANNPRKTIKDKCISCARCISVCPQGSRHFEGLLYKIASWKFTKKHQVAQPNVMTYIE